MIRYDRLICGLVASLLMMPKVNAQGYHFDLSGCYGSRYVASYLVNACYSEISTFGKIGEVISSNKQTEVLQDVGNTIETFCKSINSEYRRYLNDFPVYLGHNGDQEQPGIVFLMAYPCQSSYSFSRSTDSLITFACTLDSFRNYICKPIEINGQSL